MPDPTVLPYELWTWCVALAINGREAGPLELLAVSRRWERLLLDTPSLWNQIYIQNGEDEIARISVFLLLSRRCSLHVDIMTALPTLDSLQLIANHTSRVTTIKIRPGPSDTVTALHMERWKQVASCILARLSNGISASDVKGTSCFGFSLWQNNRLFYCVTLIEFTMESTVNSNNKQICVASAELTVTTYSQMWEKHIKRTTRISADQDANARTDSIYSLVQLASYAQHHGAIKVAISPCINLLKDDDRSVRLATIDAIQKFAVHVELRETLGLTIPSLIQLIGHGISGVRSTAVSLIVSLTEHDELREALRLATPSVIELLGNLDPNVRDTAASLHEQLTKHVELRETLELSIPSIIKLFNHWDSDVKYAAVSLLGKLVKPAVSLLRKRVKYDGLDEILTLTIRSLINPLEHPLWAAKVTAFDLLEQLARDVELRETLGLAIPSVIKLIDNWDSNILDAAASLLEQLAKHVKLRETLRLAIPPIIKLLDNNWKSNIRDAATSLLEQLAKHDDLREAIRIAAPRKNF